MKQVKPLEIIMYSSPFILILVFYTNIAIKYFNHKKEIDILESNKVEELSNEQILSIVIQHKDEFTVEKFRSYLKELNVKFPEIVFAQACLETGNFKSQVFKCNNNLFGMKQAKMRATTSKGTELKHAVYHHWKESVLDYALYQCSYLRNIKTQEDYLSYLGENYAEDPIYVKKLKIVIEMNKKDKN